MDSETIQLQINLALAQKALFEKQTQKQDAQMAANIVKLRADLVKAQAAEAAAAQQGV